MRMATAKAMPKIEAVARTGCRQTFRRTIRPAVPRCVAMKRVSSTVRRYCAGASGRMASAGGTRTARRTAVTAPPPAAASVIAVAPTTMSGEMA